MGLVMAGALFTHRTSDLLAEAAMLLREGKLVAFPTETVYGLGADGLNAQAVAAIFRAKGRPSTNPIILHVSGLAMVKRLVTHLTPQALRLMEAFWPGPLTVVLPRSLQVPDAVTAGGRTVALRMPAHPIALGLIRALDRPIAAPSANRSEHVSPTCAEHVAADLEGRIDLLLDGGPCGMGLESTVVDLSGPLPRLLRRGPLLPSHLARVLGRPLIEDDGCDEGRAASPGRSPRHYAPQVPLVLSTEALAELQRGEGRQAWLRLGSHGEAPKGVIVHDLPSDPVGYARGLYAALRELEILPVLRIVADLPPDAEPWRAVRDRLTRAAVPAAPSARSTHDHACPA
jgi:L-threonylcarbamoyladenylate synthase